ncbi:MAG: ribonuclease P protein component [Tepidisphaeraceae bacterium]|jgi:ribonuclease P protein component
MPNKTHEFPRSHRLSGKNAFAAVYAAGAKQSRGPLALYSMPNAISHYRWGLSVSRRVGPAVQRNRAKRMLRESIRLLQRDFPAAYDVVIVLRPHQPMTLAEYQKNLAALIERAHDHWSSTPPTMK